VYVHPLKRRDSAEDLVVAIRDGLDRVRRTGAKRSAG
jgi:hypothetical protein